MAAVVIAITIVTRSTVWYLNLILLTLLCAILILTLTWQDRGFYLACTGEPLVVLCSIQNLWAGLFVVCMLAGMVCGALGLLESRQDLRSFAFFCGSTVLITLLILVSNHVLVPILVLGIVTAAIIAIQSVRTYQFKKHYSGA